MSFTGHLFANDVARRIKGSLTPVFGVKTTLVLLISIAIAGCSSGVDEPENSSSPLRIRLMTGSQYTNTITALFGADISESVPAPLPPLTRTDGLLSSGAATMGMTADQLQKLKQAASLVASQVVDEEHRGFLIPCEPASDKAADADCAAEFLEKTGRLWYRRPLDDATLARYVESAGAAADELEDFYGGLAIALEGMLVSPEAIFIVEVPEPDPDNPGQFRLDAYSLASRLSFFLWDAAPSDELLRAAEGGELYTEDGLERVVDRMLASPRLEDGVRTFFADMMHFNSFRFLAKDPLAYPMVTGATLADAREQTLRTIVDHLITEKNDYRDLFTTRDTFMSMNLSVLYGVPADPGWEPYTFPEDSHRSGLLSHVSFLAAHSHPARSSVTLRGKALREIFLCQTVPRPPPNVDFSKLEDAVGLTTARERLEVHTSVPSCAGCHLIMDPIGLAMEHFDGAGKYRETEDGAALDTSGHLDGTPFNDIEGLGKVLHDHPGLPSCLVRRIYSFGTGGPVSLSKDREILEYFTKRFAELEYKVPALMREIALSEAFSQLRESTVPPPAVVAATTGESSQIARN